MISLSSDGHDKAESNFERHGQETIIQPPILDIAEICEVNDSIKIECNLQLSDSDFLLFQELASLDLGLGKEEKERLSSLIATKSPYRAPQQTYLGSAAATTLLRIRSALLTSLATRDEIFVFEGFSPPPRQESYFRRLMRMRPLQINTEVSLRGLRSVMDAYLDDFMGDKVRWVNTGRNVLRWDRQQFVLKWYLEARVRKFGIEFLYVPYENGKTEPGFRSTPTLLALEKKDALRILDVRRYLKHGLQFHIEYLLPLSEKSETHSKAEKRGGKSPKILWRGNGRLEYKGKEYILQKNAVYASLCEKIYDTCPQVGNEISAEELFLLLPPHRKYTATDTEWRKLNDNVRTANKWAKRKGLPPLFQCVKHSVKRLV